MTSWTDRIPDAENVASVRDQDGTQYRAAPDGWDYDDVVADYIADHNYPAYPVRLLVSPRIGQEAAAYTMTADATAELTLPLARTGGAHWQRP